MDLSRMLWDPGETCLSEMCVESVSTLVMSTETYPTKLPFHCQWQDLKDLFRSAGQIVRADVALGSDGRSRGFGTVLFANDADAATAVAMFNGYAQPQIPISSNSQFKYT
jgi:hypothetical protein